MDDMKEIRTQLADVREWLVRLDTKLDGMADVKKTADAANERAREALALAQENARDIAEIKTDDRRKWGAIGGMAASFIVSILIYFLTR
ncbi:hemolysin XhlA family protein [Brevibacillus agri]|uniref:hemolysin XhlA family protein n=1 Tax=Brevibacillus agri TaxID=51101 RepID=UPI001EE5994C|nr:hemolysin XhlA family protein [Brevibacillus agri]MCG5252637.1 hemolysin XhlA family protein [Brevibacillus agri]